MDHKMNVYRESDANFDPWYYARNGYYKFACNLGVSSVLNPSSIFIFSNEAAALFADSSGTIASVSVNRLLNTSKLNQPSKPSPCTTVRRSCLHGRYAPYSVSP